jgi:hypothetical protein
VCNPFPILAFNTLEFLLQCNAYIMRAVLANHLTDSSAFLCWQRQASYTD